MQLLFSPQFNRRDAALAALLIVAAVAFMPTFDLPYQVMKEWVDQGQALGVFKAALAGRWDEAFVATWMGPGWIATAKLATIVFGLEPESALLTANRLCYLAAVFGLAYFVMAHATVGPVSASRQGTLAGIVLVGTFFLSVNFTYFSTVVWSHFIALPFVVWMTVLLGDIGKRTLFRLAVIGVLLGCLTSVRMFEALAIGCAAAIWCVCMAALRLRSAGQLAWLLRMGLCLAAGFAIGYSLHAVILGKFEIFNQYSKAMPYPDSALFSMRFPDLPIKLVQLFVDPCFMATCGEVQWSKDEPLLAATGLNSFHYPLLLQVPILAWGLIAWTWMSWAYRRRLLAVLQDPCTGIALLAAAIVVVGYSSVLYVGSDRLRFGFVREYMSATFLLMMATVRALALLRPTTEAAAGRSPRQQLLVLAAPVVAIGLLQLPIRGNGFIHFPDFAISSIGADVNCGETACRLSPWYDTASGRHSWPRFYDRAILARRCQGDEEVQRDLVRLGDFIYHRNECANGTEITFLPTVTGASLNLSVGQGRGATARIDWRPPYVLGTELSFAGNEDSTAAFIGTGWSVGEAWGRWTEGERASLSMHLGDAPSSDLRLRASLVGFVRPANPTVEVDVLAAGSRIGHWSVTNASDFEDHVAVIPADAVDEDGTLTLEFVVANPKSPASLGESQDPRHLGIGVRMLSVDTHRP